MTDHTVNIRQVTRIDFWDGFRFAWGVLTFAVLVVFAVQLADDYIWQSPFDDSDAPPKRSGMRIKTDNLTGCQYLVAPFGSITPRLNGEGKQICARSSAGLEQRTSNPQVAGSTPAERTTRSAPAVGTSQLRAERDPSVMPDSHGADTTLSVSRPASNSEAK